MQTKLERRLVVECAWCRGRYLIPTSWAGTVQTCIHCGRVGRAYGYLSAPERVLPAAMPAKRPDPDAYDCHGGLIAALIFVAGFWAVVASVVAWIW